MSSPSYACTNPRCGMPFPADLVLGGEAAAAPRSRRRAGGRPIMRFTHVCGACRTLHHRTDDGAALRPLTVPERFRLELFCPDLVRKVESVPVPSGGVAVFVGPRENG